MKTGLVFFPAFDWAISPTHPEREERLLYTRDQLFEEGIMDLPQIVEYQPRMASDKDIARTHFCVPGVKDQATDAHRISCGGALTIADAVMQGEVKNGFALVRPPGHHAMRVAHGNRGFCNINNEAIMVDYLRKVYGLKKIAIVDTDVHHGDGTQEIFWHDPDVLFISFHQDGRTLYPGSGFTDEIGGPLAMGYTLNVPLPPSTTDVGILHVIDELVKPVLQDFKPDLVVNSAGQDNHFTDPLANMRFSARGYAELNKRLAPDIAVLEGGYSVETALPYVNTGIIMAMAGIDYGSLYEPEYDPKMFQESPQRMDTLKKIIEELQTVWQRRERLIEAARGKWEKFYQRHKPIYYDTDGIHEEQTETLRMCPSCAGYMTIDSQAFGRRGQDHRIMGISIPVNGCRNCQNDARELYDGLKKKGGDRFDFVYLQDKANNDLLRYTIRTGQEIRFE
ncbi:MAG: histone deacetylase [Candidatus Saccharibacteria bacterium]